MIEAVFFDLDGTLADTERQNAAAVTAVLARHGRPTTEEEKEYVVGHGWAEIYHHLCSHGGVELSYTELVEQSAAERQAIVAREGLTVLPGAVEAVRHVAGRYPTAVVSGSSRSEIALCLRLLGVADYFPFFVGAEDTPRGKPFADGYLLAARHFAVDPAACLVIEDSAAGITAARRAGMICLAIRAGNFAGQRQDEAHLILDTLTELDDRRLTHLASSLFSRTLA